MVVSRRIAFIINPKAGVKKKMDIPAFIAEHISSACTYEIFLWDKVEAFNEIDQKIKAGNFDVAVAVGGDGTVNRVAAMVNGTEMALGVLPFGSGNGLARTVGVSMDIRTALQQVCSGSIKKVDSATINGIPFFCTAGTGFDAHIGKLFAQSQKRGFNTYFKITTRELFSYQPKQYELTIDGVKKNFEAFLITVCNAGQWGNDVFICPDASITDGLLHVTVLKKFPKLKMLGIAGKLIRKKINSSAYSEILSGKKITITRPEKDAAHYDGEPAEMDKELVFEIKPESLKVVS